jgi:hypothetical protein
MSERLPNPEMLMTAYERSVIGMYRGWGAMAKAENQAAADAGQPLPHAFPVIDHDLAPKFDDFPSYNNIHEVVAAIDSLIEALPEDARDREMVEAKLKAARLMAGAKAGEDMPYETLVESTMGIKPVRVDDEVLDLTTGLLDKILAQQGMHYGPSYKDRFYRDRLPGEQVEETFEEIREYGDKVFEAHSRQPEEPVETHYEPFDDFWAGYIFTGENGDFHLNYNINEERAPQNIGRVMLMDKHEIKGHLKQLSSIKESVMSGEISPIHGIVTVYDQGATHLETVAHMMEQMLEYGNDWQEQFENVLSIHRLLVLNNNHYDLAMGYKTPEEAEAYARKYLPFEPDTQLKAAEIVKRVMDPMILAYMSAYIPSVLLGVGSHLMDLEPEKQRIRLAELYKRPLSVENIEQLTGATMSKTAVARTIGRLAANANNRLHFDS